MATKTFTPTFNQGTPKPKKSKVIAPRSDSNLRVSAKALPTLDAIDGAHWIVVREGRVIFKSEMKEPAKEILKQFPGSVLCRRDDAPPRTHAGSPKRPADNPVAEVVKSLSSDAVDAAFDILNETLDGVMICDHGTQALAWVASEDDPRVGEYETATNKEASELYFTLNLGIIVDLCEDLPDAMMNACKEMISRYTAAIERLSEMQDERNLKLIRKVVRNLDYLPNLVAKGMTLDETGKEVQDDSLENRQQIAEEEKLKPQWTHWPVSTFTGIASAEFAVVDASRLLLKTDRLHDAVSFANGRAGDAIVVGMPSEAAIIEANAIRSEV